MACITLKRPLEWIDPSMSASEPSGSSSPTSMCISNSPPHSAGHSYGRSPKRLCLHSSQSAYSSPSTCHYPSFTSSSTTTNPTSLSISNNYFKPISSTEVADQIREEMRRLRIVRRTLSIGKRRIETNSSDDETSTTAAVANTTTTTSANIGNKSPSPSESSMNSSPSSSPRRPEEDTSGTPQQQQPPPHPYHLYTSLISQSNDSEKKSLSSKKSTTSISNNSGSRNEKPLFTFNQVVMIVERLLREKEDLIRREYETALTTRLAEQYDQFVKFAYDQIQRRFDSQSLPSYLS